MQYQIVANNMLVSAFFDQNPKSCLSALRLVHWCKYFNVSGPLLCCVELGTRTTNLSFFMIATRQAQLKTTEPSPGFCEGDIVIGPTLQMRKQSGTAGYGRHSIKSKQLVPIICVLSFVGEQAAPTSSQGYFIWLQMSQSPRAKSEQCYHPRSLLLQWGR